MRSTEARIWQQLMELSPLCSGSLHEQCLACGKANCRCHDAQRPQLHGPYYLWQRRIEGQRVHRTLRPGPELERVRQGIANYQKAQKLFGELLQQEESQVLGAERAVPKGVKKTSSGDWGSVERGFGRFAVGAARAGGINRQRR